MLMSMTSVDTEAARKARRAQRHAWPGRVSRCGEHPDLDVSSLTPDERIRAVWTATLAAWLLGGHSLPNVPRAEWPGELRRAT